MNETVEVFSPVGAEVVTKGESAPRLETLDGKTVGEGSPTASRWR